MGIQQHNAPQANRPSGLPSNFQAPPNMPNINFNAPVIRLGTGSGRSAPPAAQEPERPSGGGHGRAGIGMERGSDQSRQPKEPIVTLVPPTHEEKLQTIFIYQIPESLHAADAMEKLLKAAGGLRRWDASNSTSDDRKGTKFGFALYNDPESLARAVKLLHDESIEVPVQRQSPGATDAPEDDTYEGIEKTKLLVTIDPNTIKYLESRAEDKGEDAESDPSLERARNALRSVVRELFYPPAGAVADADGDVAMKNPENGENVEVVNITLAQDDELADIPPEMREVVAGEIAAFRERSTQRDLERMKKEEEMEEMERHRDGSSRISRMEMPSTGVGSNAVPLGPRGSTIANAPSGPKGQNGTGGRVPFVAGGVSNAEYSVNREDDETDADDEELQRRRLAKQKADDDHAYAEAERKWANRERSRQAALEREQERERQDSESYEHRREEQLERDKAWDDEKEASRKQHPYYKDHANWARKRNAERQDEEHRDESDRRAEQNERRKEKAEMERARGLADSFLDQQAEEMDKTKVDPAPAPQPFKLSLGAAAQKAQASRGTQRRTVAEVEGLLDDEEADTSTKRQLIPIKFDSNTGTAGMSDEEISQAVRALAQEIPSDKEGLWNWEVKWEFMDDAVVSGKLRPFVEKKIVEYLGVQEEMLVAAVDEHLRSHGTAAALAEELEGALDDEAEDLVKKLWRMVIFFTESEKRGLPA